MSVLFPEFEWIIYPIRVVFEYLLGFLGYNGFYQISNSLKQIIKLRRKNKTVNKDLLQLMLDSVVNEDGIEIKNKGNHY